MPLTLADPSWDETAWTRWGDYLSAVEQRVYKSLRKHALDGYTEVDLITFAKNLGVSQAAFAKAMYRLESVGLLEDVSE
jgi:Mn-dependent DtxR family transcriptional regulator